MKKLNLKLSLALCIFIAVNKLNAQETDPSLGSSDPCIQGASPWVLGGNNVNFNPNNLPRPIPYLNDAGTCNNYPFVLKANNFQSVFIWPSGNIGINNPSPIAALDIRHPNPSNQSTFRIYADTWGNVESTTHMNFNFATGSDFSINEGSINNPINRLIIKNNTGNVGIGIGNPQFKLTVADGANADMGVLNFGGGPAGVWAANVSQAFGLQIDAQGVGHIVENPLSPLKLLNFEWNLNLSKPQVWVGYTKPLAPHDDFDFAVAGKILAQSIYVTASSNWADYVFEKNYKLMPLKEVEKFVRANKHLPEIPAACEINGEGNRLNLGEMQTLQMSKIEELFLYVINLQKEIDELKKQNQELLEKIR